MAAIRRAIVKVASVCKLVKIEKPHLEPIALGQQTPVYLFKPIRAIPVLIGYLGNLVSRRRFVDNVGSFVKEPSQLRHCLVNRVIACKDVNGASNHRNNDSICVVGTEFVQAIRTQLPKGRLPSETLTETNPLNIWEGAVAPIIFAAKGLQCKS